MRSSIRRLAAQVAAVVFVLSAVRPAAAADNDCDIYPIALPHDVVATLDPGELVPQLPRGTGPGNYSWLSWTGANDAPTLAASLAVPGNSANWFNPDRPDDRSIDAGDWIQGGPGSTNSSAVRAAMDILLTRDIVLPVYDATRGQGSRFDYRTIRFASVRLKDYRLTGQGYIAFQYKGEADCYNAAPVAHAQSVSTEENTPLDIELDASDDDGDALEFFVVEAPAHGSLSGTGSTLTYTPHADYHGPDAFRFAVRDGDSESAPATVDITVLDGNDAPIAQPQTLETQEDTPIAIVLSATDADGDALSYEILEGPATGELTGTPPSLTYTPPPQWHGTASFTFRADDGEAPSDAARIDIVVTPVNDAPQAQPQSLETDEDTPLAIVLQGADADGDALEYTIVGEPSHGTLTLTGAQANYVPANGYHGDDAFEFRVTDPAGARHEARVDLRVLPVNDPPRIASTGAETGKVGVPYSYDASATDPDLGDVLSWQLLQAPAGMTIDAASGAISWTPSIAQAGANEVALRVTDAAGASDEQRYTVTLEQRDNAAPQIVTTPVPTATESQPYRYDLDAVDPDGDALVHALSSAPAGAGIDAASGVIDWNAPAALSRGSLAPHQLCQVPAPGQAPQQNRTVDLITVLDRSGSMKDEQEWVADTVPVLEASLYARGVGLQRDNRYGLIDFDEYPRSFPLDGAPFGSHQAFSQTARPLKADGPGFEDGYLAIDYALQNYAFRSEAARNLLLITDEGRTPTANDPYTLEGMLAALRAKGVMVNAALNIDARCPDGRIALGVRRLPDPAAAGGFRYEGLVADGEGGVAHCAGVRILGGHKNTVDVYVPLAFATGGIAWNLNQLRTGGHYAVSFSRALVQAKVEEIVGQTRLESRADLVVAAVAYVDDDPQVRVEVRNRGLVASEATSVMLSALGPGGEASLGARPLAALPAGASEVLAFEMPADTPVDEFVARIGTRSVADCDAGNDTLHAPVFSATATDPLDLSDRQSWAVTVAEENSAPHFEGDAPAAAQVGYRYAYTARAVDDDRGDAVAYRLLQAPLGMQIDALSGELHFTPATHQIGTHPVRILATDLEGATAERSFDLAVAQGDPLPRITSTAPARAVQGTVWIYQPTGTGLAGVTFTMIDGPDGMTIDTATGRLDWNVPADAPQDSWEFVLVVLTRADGASAVHVFEVFVDSPNTAPTVTGTPLIDAYVGNTYEWDPGVVDANAREVFAWSLSRAPQSMVLADGERLHWGYPVVQSEFPETNALFDFYCRAPEAIGVSPAMREQWRWNGAWAMGAPVAAQLGEGPVSLAIVGTTSTPAGTRGALIALDPRTGAKQWQYSARALDAQVAIAAADLDADGRDELLAFTTGTQLVAINADGTERWVSAALAGNFADAWIAPADLDGDGRPEILIGGYVFGADGMQRWRFDGAAQQHRGTALAADVDLDGAPEVFFHNQQRDAAGTPVRTFALGGTARTVLWSAGNLDAEPGLELIAVAAFDSHEDLRALRRDGSALFAPIALQDPGRVVVADFDNDGANEIFVGRDQKLIEGDGRIVYGLPTGSTNAAPLGADLDGDGALELVVTTNGVLRISAAATLSALGIAADDQASAEGQGAILVDIGGEGWLFTGGEGNLRAWRAASGAWRAPLIAPKSQALHPGVDGPQALRGTYNLVSPHGTASTPLADLRVGGMALTESGSSGEVRLEVHNRGLASADGARLRVFAGKPESGGALLHEAVLPPIAAGQRQAASFAVGDLAALRNELHAIVEAGTPQQECRTANNRVAAHVVEVKVTDHDGLHDTLTYLLRVNRHNTTPTFASAPVRNAAELQPYAYDVQANDVDVGDRPIFSLETAPAGASIDPASGLIRWTPARGQAGTHAFVVRITDLKDLGPRQSFSVTVSEAPNSAPRFTSTPPLQTLTQRPYVYDAVAVDDQGDPVTYSLRDPQPGMTIGASSGHLTWVPTAAGSFSVTILASDDRQGVTAQEYTVVVEQDDAPLVDASDVSGLARADTPYAETLHASDAEGQTLAWTPISVPPGMTVGADGQISWTPSAEDIGLHIVQVQVSDGVNEVDVSWLIRVAAADALPQILVIIEPDVPSPDQPVLVSIQTELDLPYDVRLDATPLAVDEDGRATLPPQAIGPHEITVRMGAPEGPVVETEEFVVADPAGGAPQVSLTAPDDAQIVTAPIQVVGAVIDTDIVRWSLGFQDRNGGPIVELASGTQAFTEHDIARFDPTRLLNGQYHFVLQAWDALGNHGFDSRVVRVEGDLKLGHYSITFEEATIPVAGIPVTVTRTYDTRRRLESLDFGHGWTVDANNVRVHESRRLGFGWQMHRLERGFIDEYCLLSNGDPIVTVTLPDGDVESFRAVAYPECGPTPRVDVHVMFEPIDGTDSTLTSPSYGTVRFSGSNLVDLSDPQLQPIDPSGYTLTTAEGLSYEIAQFEGLKKVSEPNGAWLTYGPDGVRHSSGVGIDFVRDAQGRIERMVLPDGTFLEYAYSPTGDLLGLTDTGGETAAFGYHARFAHYLETIEDARGIVVSRNEYDDNGKLQAVIDAKGHRIEYTHDVDARSASVKNRRGHTTTYVYNGRGDVLSETNALGETTSHTYDADGNELTRTDDLGRTTTWTYDTRGNVLTETNHLGETTTSTWNPQNQLLTQHDDSGTLVLENEYINHGLNLYRTEDALGHETYFRYDFGPGSSNTGNVDTITDAAGNTTSMAYAAFTTFQVSETDALGRKTEMIHDDLGRRIEESRTRTGADGSVETLVTTFDYDDKGRLLSTTHPDGTTTTAEYDGLDQPIKECDALQRCTEHVYDERGLEIETKYADGSSEHKTYDENGNLLTQTDRNGEVTTFVYDAADRLVETVHPDETPATDADNPRSFNVYDGAGQLIESIDENGHSTTYDYDDAGRQTDVTDAVDRVMHTGYDNRGRRTTATDPAGRVTRFVHDDAGRVIETIHPDPSADDGNDANNPRTRTEYDVLGRKTADIDEAGRTTRYGYDKLGRLVLVVLPDAVTGANPALVNGESPSPTTLVTRYTYDEVGNKLTQTDAEGRTTRWEYDAMGRETARVLPEGQRETRTYNDAGELESHTDFNGVTTRYDYDLAGRLETIDYPQDADVGFGYNARGERTSAVDARGTSTTQFDARSRTVQVHDADGGLIEYEYDAAGNLLARISPSQSLVYTYDDANRLQSVTRTVDGEAPTVTEYDYDAAGNRSVMIGGDGTRTEYTYDRRNRLTGLLKKTAAGALLVGMTYGVDATGMRTAIEETDPAGVTRTVAYTYDDVKRLTSETIDHREAAHDRATAWTYDRVGNRQTQTLTASAGNEVTSYTYDDNDRLLTETNSVSGLTTYSYDDNGNTLSKATATESTTYAYDDANRLIQAITPTATVDYVYDADGLRVRQIVTPPTGQPTTTWYLQDNSYSYAQVVEENISHGSGAKKLAATFTFADELVSQTRYASGTPTTRFIQPDGFGSTRWLTDGAGLITDKVDYDAFGAEIARTGPADIEHLYRGEVFDSEAALYNLRARWMDPSLGRFTQQDSFNGLETTPQSLHKYIYANADPITGRDPSGFMTMPEMNVGFAVNATRLTMSTARVGTINIGRAAANDALWTAAATAGSGARAIVLGILTAVALNSDSRDRDRLGSTPMIVFGKELHGHAQHIFDAQNGNGSNFVPAPFALNRISPWPRGWLRYTSECNDEARERAGPAKACDEYPFASSRQGGPVKYAFESVSLRFLPIEESDRTRNFIGSFYSRGMVTNDGYSKASRFLAFGVPGVKSFYTDRAGTKHFLEP